ncbi:NAD(P)/FAD-dependent oxidoreductase [Mesoterricola sediminis]|uniref:FAD-dependent oxidoreductase n=1 Tax=Mesoterricola sediminis TaxID=2927980 RepID=A0AA48H170_9BACT|nr:NAD(P)/FAD-dependent oxidoreductase [Mesoterricola sediminis]BDU75601.1 FAD-dependent oxidoreductase [Mesoterricola sediminis]
MERVQTAVLGAGVVGLALARRLASEGREVVILEAADRIGTGASSRNSEVIHAGVYYAPGSLKARLCAPGRQALYAYCAARGIAHRRCGKLIVAGPGQEAALRALRARGEANGAGDLQEMDGAGARALEPEVRCAAALLSPETGIVDSHGLMRALLADAEAEGAVLVLRSPVLGGAAAPGGVMLRVGGEAPLELLAERVYNCAGLGAHALAGRIDGLRREALPPFHRAKGSYFALAAPAPFSRLVYPVPEAAGLGVHLTLDLAGQARFGPDVEWVEAEDYAVDPRRAEAFYGAIRAYWPGLPDGALQPAYAGIRAKLQGPGEPARDWLAQGPGEHGVPGLVNLLGIESPGLTACLALADHVAGLPV